MQSYLGILIFLFTGAGPGGFMEKGALEHHITVRSTTVHGSDPIAPTVIRCYSSISTVF